MAEEKKSTGTEEGRKLAMFETKPAPWLSGLSTDKLIEFKRLYERYEREWKIAVQASGSTASIPFKMVDCVEPWLLRTICKFGGIASAPTVDTLVDAELLEFIDLEIGKPLKDQTTMLPLDQLAKKHLEYDMSEPVRARVFGLFQSFDKRVEVENLKPRLTGTNVKKVGKLLVDSLKPGGLRAVVRNHCEELHGKEPYKSLENMFQIIIDIATTHEAVHVARESARGERSDDGDRSANRLGRRGGRGDRG